MFHSKIPTLIKAHCIAAVKGIQTQTDEDLEIYRSDAEFSSSWESINSSWITSESVDCMAIITHALFKLPKLLESRNHCEGMIQVIFNDRFKSEGEIVQFIRHELVWIAVGIPPQKPEFGNSVILVVGSDVRTFEFVADDVLKGIPKSFMPIIDVNLIGRVDEWLITGGLQALRSDMTSDQDDACVVILCTQDEFRRICDSLPKVFVPIQNEEENLSTGAPKCTKETIEFKALVSTLNSEAQKSMPSPVTEDINASVKENQDMKLVRPKSITSQPHKTFHLNVNWEKRHTETGTTTDEDDTKGGGSKKFDEKETGVCEEISCCIFSTIF